MKHRTVSASLAGLLGAAGIVAAAASAATAADGNGHAPARVGLSAKRAATQPIDCVSPFLGTDAHGHTYPGATVPFGMVQLSPDTRTQGWDGSSGYHYSDSTIQGFSHTHLAGTGVGCMGDIMLMPTVGAPRFDVGKPGDGYISRFSHAHETASPGYYRVFLEDPRVTAELTATARCGFHRYTFPATDQAHIILDLDHNIGNDTRQSKAVVEDDRTISGSRKSSGWGGERTVYFVMQFSRPFAGAEGRGDAIVVAGKTMTEAGPKSKVALTFHTNKDEAVLVKVGISATSIDEARKNLQTEIPGWDFDAVHAAARRKWADALASVQIETPDPHVRATFYTNLYLSYQAPTLFNDADGSYLGTDHKVHANAAFQNYTTFSLWDTFRAEHPLLTILQPARVDYMMNSLLAEYRESGLHTTPIWPLWGNETWCMIGYHSVSVIADAYLKGFRGFDAEAAYQAMRDTAMQDRNGLASYKAKGYVASSAGAAATSKTLEYDVDDWSLARMAESLGHKDDAALFYTRAANYRNTFDGATRFMRGRKADGTWRRPFDTHGLVNDEYTEADAWQYAFAVQQDVPGMIDLYGGDAGFIEKLDSLFVQDSTIHTGIPDISGLIGQFSQGDEQCHHVAYLYDYAGQPYKTQQRVRQIMSTLYNDSPAGQCGNNDCGQMSAWYVLSAMGFYSVNPASGVYEIGSPAVNKAVLRLDAAKYGGKTFTLLAENNSPENIYVQSATWDGKPFNRTWFTHKELTAGGTLRLTMGPKPSTAWASAAESRPPATMPAGFRYAALPAPAEDKPIALTLPIRIVCGSDEPAGSFVSDPNMLDGATNADDGKQIDVSAPHSAPALVYQSERYANDFTYAFDVPKDKSYTIRLHFAEIFDDERGMRQEDVRINGAPVLTKFDILATAGSVNKAVVKEFADIRPNSDGKITIRFSASKSSPDQNAKVNGIEILPNGQ